MTAAAPIAPKSQRKKKQSTLASRLDTAIGQLHADVLDDIVARLKADLGEGKAYNAIEIRDRHETAYVRAVLGKFPRSHERDSSDERLTHKYLHGRTMVFDDIYGSRSAYFETVVREDGTQYVPKCAPPKFDTELGLNALYSWAVTVLADQDKENGQWK